MDPITAAHTALVVLTPYLVKGGEGLASTMAKDLWEKFKSLFVISGDEKVLTELTLAPAEQRNLARAEYIAEKELTRNKVLLDEMAIILNKYPQTNTQSNLTQTGNNNIAVANINNSSININGK
jgi:hypothetical protein